MPSFGNRSLSCLATVHPDLQRVAQDAIRHSDFAVICGYRGKAEQEVAFSRGMSKARWGQSPHNFSPAFAFDAVPWPVDWNDLASFAHLATVIKAAAVRQNVPITWGGDFKRFKDRPHFELTGWQSMARQVKV